MNGALGFVFNRKVRLERMSPDAIGHMRSTSNDVQNSVGAVYILSGPDSHGDGWSITPKNFERSMICFAARKLVRPTWLNHQDQFDQPDEAHLTYKQFALDAVVWSLFNGKNQTSSVHGVKYKDVVYDIDNHFFWIKPETMSKFRGLPHPIFNQCGRAKPRFVSEWLDGKKFSPDVEELLGLGTKLVELSADRRPHADPRYQLDRWDAGWYQIRNGLYGKDVKFKVPQAMTDVWVEFEARREAVTERLRPLIYELAFLPKEDLLPNEEGRL